jgi:hypothetical protein
MLSAWEYLKSIYETSPSRLSLSFHPLIPQAISSISAHIIAFSGSQLATNDTPHSFEAVRDTPSEDAYFGHCVRGKE